MSFEHVSRFSSCRKKVVKLVLTFLNGYECDEYNFELERFPHIGEVKIGNNVEVTSNCSISRGALSDTPNLAMVQDWIGSRISRQFQSKV